MNAVPALEAQQRTLPSAASSSADRSPIVCFHYSLQALPRIIPENCRRSSASMLTLSEAKCTKITELSPKSASYFEVADSSCKFPIAAL